MEESIILNSHHTSQNDYFTSVSTMKGSCPNCFHHLTIIVFLPHAYHILIMTIKYFPNSKRKARHRL